MSLDAGKHTSTHGDAVGLGHSVSLGVSIHATTHAKVYGYIRTHPGAHLRKICRGLDLAVGDVQYHLYKLEKEGAIRSARRGLYKFFYPSNLFADGQSNILGTLSLRRRRGNSCSI